MFTSQQKFPLPLAVANFQTQYAQNTATILAFTGLSMLPALGCFIFAQRHLVGGFTGGSEGLRAHRPARLGESPARAGGWPQARPANPPHGGGRRQG